ncbi:S24 family peptidase [Cloacibacillus porcorum]|uniref:S24 family peptidase n=1 Tax=Cloacibacillus porcorum TaxID=1197717 RepID=UPI00389A3BA4
MVLFAQFCEVNDGDIIVVALDGRVFVKGIVKMTKASILLRSYNWQVAPDLDIPLDGSSEIAILGKVIDVISKRKLPRII